MLDLFEQEWQELWQDAHAVEPVGAVFTRPEIVALILDLAGYRVGARRLATLRVLEPSCGDGAFLAEVVRRLIESEREHCATIDWDDTALCDAIRAVDISRESLASAHDQLQQQLVAAGCPSGRAEQLASCWTVHADFLLQSWPQPFDLIVGNPPYVRIEELPRRVLQRYREIFDTTTDRADIYVAFIEKGLQLLSADGALAFICANRFAKNKYGEALRRLIAQKYHVLFYINLEHTQPFLSAVSAYPAIIVLDRQHGKPTRAASLEDINSATLEAIQRELVGRRRPRGLVSEFRDWYPGGTPWITTSSTEHELLDRLHSRLPVLEDSAPQTKVGIGVATGADDVFVLKGQSEDIEASRQIPMLMAYDIGNQGLAWSGRFLVNPFDAIDDGSLVRLQDYPGLAAYLEEHAAELKKRHVAKGRPTTWYRTIDRIWPSLRMRPKLVIPDIQATVTIGLDEGKFYPHHNVYWITSESWPLLALKALLRSAIVIQQVRAYSVQMRGGSLRFQAQTLRRLRLPQLRDVPDGLLDRLSQLANSVEQAEIDAIGAEAFAPFTRGR
jgi:methylase of polypeptide subunit release factors